MSGVTNGWVTTSIGEICEFKYGKSLPASTRSGGSIPVYGSNGIVGGHDAALTNGPTIVIGRKGSYGEVNFSPVSCWPIDTTYYVDATATEADLRWLALRLTNAGLNQMNRAAAVPGLNREDAYRVKVRLPPLPEQRRIAAILDQAETLRTQRRAALAHLDSLTQSLFLDTFGDPVTNQHQFETCALGEIIEFVGGSQPAKEHFVYEPSPDVVRLVQIRDFRTDEFKTYIPRNLARRTFEVDDVMIGRYGPPVFQIFRGLSGSYNVALMKALPKEGVLRDFIFFLLQEPGLHGYVVDRSTRTAGQSGVNLELLENYPAFRPPLPLQQTFATRVQAIEALKTQHRAALAAQDALFASLQQRAFAGTL